VTFGARNAFIKEICNAGIGDSEKTYMKWEPIIAWLPIKIKNRYVWLKKIYRRTIYYRFNEEGVLEYEYGDLFTILEKGTENE